MIAAQKPSFIVVGPPRTGTSWLRKVLEPHATLPSPSKETRFFDLHYHRGPAWYDWHFPRDRKGPIGEIAPTYFASSEARARIAETLPNAKIVFSFRNPIERAVSLYRLKRAYGMFRWSFDEALRNDPELINSGLYWSHLSGWQECFPPEQLLVSIYDDLVSDAQGFVDRITAFTGLSPITVSQSQLQRVYSSERMTQPRSYIATRLATSVANWCKSRHLDHFVESVRESALLNLFLGGGESLPSISPSTLAELAEIFRPEVDALESHLGRRLEHWKSPNMRQEQDVPEGEFAARGVAATECSTP
jgi:hypothetical protein